VEAPVVLGFGIGSVEAATQAAKEADGIIIGSKLMQLLREGGTADVREWLMEVRGALSDAARVGG
jgi:tryptophan synthase alpha chain